MLTAQSNPVVMAERIFRVTPHAGQIAFLLDSHPVRVLIGGRRAGKTMALALDIAWRLVRSHSVGKRAKLLITARTIAQAELVLDAVVRLLRQSPAGGLITGQLRSPFPELSLGDFASVTARSASEGGKNLRGLGLSGVVVDEAGFLDERIIQEVLAPALADEGGWLTLSSTPTVIGGLLHRYFERGRNGEDPHIRSFHWTSLSNPHLDRQYVEAQRHELSRRQWEVEWLGEFGDATNSLFRWNDVSACIDDSSIVSSLGDEGPRRFIVGWDPAKLRDRSGLIVIDTTELPCRVVELHDLARRDYTEQVESVVEIAGRYGNARVVIDATGNMALADLLKSRGAWVQPEVFTASKKTELFTDLAMAVEKRLLLFPADERLLAELRWFQIERTATGTVRYEAAPGQHDDLLCALALAWHHAGPAVRPRMAPLPFLTSSVGIRNNPLVPADADSQSAPDSGLWETLPMPFLRG
jgi:hypothetical protein